jgi:glutamate 5-kinase
VATEKTRKSILNKINRVVLKLGSYVLTTPSGKLDRKVFSDVVKSIDKIRQGGTEFVLVSSGAIATGMGKLKLEDRPTTLSREQAVAAIGQINLMGLYGRLFSKFDTHTAQLLLTHSDLRDRKRFLNARQTLNSVLEYNAVPIINENDSTVVEEIKFGDNDFLSSLVTNLVQADLLIILTDIDGFYDKDPRRYHNAKLIPLVKNIDSSIEKLALGTRNKISRGGMNSKIKAAKTAARFGVPTIIANGKTPENLLNIFRGKDIGTLILPEKNKLTSRKHWIAFTLKPQGQIYVDNGAKSAIIEKNRSLLPTGITSVMGNFDRGEAVSCCNINGLEFARGITAYSSTDINKIKGLKTSLINKSLGYCYSTEIINRDDMVIINN